MSSSFASFTFEEVESIRAVVMIGQQNDDTLISQCTQRKMPEVKAFIRRFKKHLLDPQTSSQEIAELANQQYVAIITAARMKKNPKPFQMTTALSVSNLASPFLTFPESLPFKFRGKFSLPDPTVDESIKKTAPLPTRSKSVSTGLNYTASGEVSTSDDYLDQPFSHRKNQILIIPPISARFPKACRSVEEITPGCLAAVLHSQSGPTIFCRVLCTKDINNVPHALISYFQKDMPPCYVQLHHLVLLNQQHEDEESQTPHTTSVDKILEQMFVKSQSPVFHSDPTGSLGNMSSASFQKRTLLFQLLVAASQIQLLSYISNWSVPQDKQTKLFDILSSMCTPKFASTATINERSRRLINLILTKINERSE